MSLIDRLLKKNRDHAKRDESSVTSEAAAPVKDAAQSSAAFDFTTILSEIGQIEDIIGGDDGEGRSDDMTTLEVRVRDLLKALPAELKSMDAPPPDTDEKAPIIIKNLFDQLSRGRITARLADLVTRIPERLLSADYGDHLADEIKLPLPMVVNAISPDALKQRTATQERESGIHAMPDVFGRETEPEPPPATPADEAATAAPAPETTPTSETTAAATVPASPVADTTAMPVTEPEPPPLEEPEPAAEIAPAAEAEPEPVAEIVPAAEPEPEPVAEIEPEPVAEETPVEEVVEPLRTAPPEPLGAPPPPATPSIAPEPAPKAVHLPPATPIKPIAQPLPKREETAAPATAHPDIAVRVNEIDINAASVRDLVKHLPGIGPGLAKRIVAGRPYRSIFDLSAVPGIGPRLLRRLSGVPIPAGGVSTDEVEAILGAANTRLPPLRDVAARIAKISGISGCILSQSDGYVLASAWRRGEGQALGAIAPQIFKQIERYFNLLHMDGPQSVTLFVEPRPVFITMQRDIFVIVFVPRSRFSMRRIEVIETVAAELARRLHRHSAE